jgi:hypothetical protein
MKHFSQETVIAISEYLVKVLKDEVPPVIATEALVGAVVIVHRMSGISADIEETAEIIRQLIIRMDKEITSELVN